MRQTSFEFFRNYKKTFGGSALVGRRKEKRPLSIKSPIHLILKSENHKVFRPANQSLHRLILETARKFNIQVRDFAMNWSHSHFVIQISSRQDYVRFIRALTSKMAMAVQKAQVQKTKLFTLRPFSRILNWGRDYRNVIQYIFLNFKEALGKTRESKQAPKSSSSNYGKNMRASYAHKDNL